MPPPSEGARLTQGARDPRSRRKSRSSLIWVKGGCRRQADGTAGLPSAPETPYAPNDVAGRGNGFVDIYDTDGHLLQRFASRRPLNSPWGVTRASFACGRFSGDILVGNFGDGQINAFDSDGNFRGILRGDKGKPIAIDGLWTLTLGGGRNSNSDTLYFTAGPNGETGGLFGTITPASDNEDN